MKPADNWHTKDTDFALYFLTTAQQDYDHAKRMRVYYAQNAKRRGITNQEIGDIFGMTEGGVRRLLKAEAAEHNDK